MIDADDALSLIENNKMENPNNVQIVAFANDGILIDDTKDFAEKGEDIKTTEYFLDVGEEHMEEENVDEQFVTIENSCKDGEEQFITVGIEDTAGAILDDKEVILWNELCRICANGSDRFIPIFTDEGLEHELSNKIHTYLPLEVSETDTLPHQLCYNCAATLLAWHEMIKGCLDAQQRLEEMHNKFQLKDQYYNDSANEEENIQAVSEIEMTNNEEANDQNKEVQNMETVQIVEATDSDRCVSLSDGDVICTILTTMPSTPSPAKERRKRKPRDPLSTSKRQSKAAPVLSKEASARNLQRRQEAARAKVVSEGTTYYKCDECSKLLSTSYNFFAHKRIHTKEKLCTCEMCGKSFTASSSLTRHVRDVHYQIKEYKCAFCERKLASKIARDEHQRTHTDERPHFCEQCGKSFRQRASLSVHKRFHSKSFLFNCKLCNRGFPRKQDMERHELTHTDQKPYGCKLCSKTFRSSASAIRHRQTHGTESKHMCEECGESFNQERYLKNHKRKVHKND